MDLGTEPDELVDAAELMVLAIDGLKERFDVMAWQNEALQFGARMMHERPERVAAAINKRPTRWMTGLPEAYASAASEKAGAGESES